MMGEPIDRLNDGLAAMIRHLQTDPSSKESVHLLLISYGDSARIVVPLTSITEVRLPRLTAGGLAAAGAAIKLAESELAESELADKVKITHRWIPPLIVLCSVGGIPNDSWEEPLRAFKNHPRVSSAALAAVAMSPEAVDGVFLAEFAKPDGVVLDVCLRPDWGAYLFTQATYVRERRGP
jgi:uncharacterized protein YegL